MRKKTQNRTPFRLAHGLSLFEPLTARSDQSLSPVGGLHPHVLRSCFSFEPTALACRSRFVVAKLISKKEATLSRGCGSRSRTLVSDSDALPCLCGLCFFLMYPQI